MLVAIAVPFGFRCPGKRPTSNPTGPGSTSSGMGGSEGGMGGMATGTGGDGGNGGSGGFGPCVDTDPAVDDDLDGFTNLEGDCDDCDPLSNPQGVELPTEGNDTPADENCDGNIDEGPTACDAGLTLTTNSAFDAATALDLCKISSGVGDWGLADARWTRADGTLLSADAGLQAGLSSQFGININPQLGVRMLVLSTGNARDVNDPDPCLMTGCGPETSGTVLSNFPQSVGACETGTVINDDIALEIDLRAPSNVAGMRFEHAFASFEFPEWVCTPFNDQFLALVTPPVQGNINGNVVFDLSGTPPSSFFEVFDHCDPNTASFYATQCMAGCPAAPSPYCPQGSAFFDGTGFNEWGAEHAGGTGWLETIVPVLPGSEFTVRFTIFDVGDFNFDSTVWIDAVGWVRSANPMTPETFVLANPN